MDSYFKEKNGQDQPDRLDHTAFGRKAPRRRQKNFYPVRYLQPLTKGS